MLERMSYATDRRDEERDGKKEATKENAHGRRSAGIDRPER